VRNLASGGAIAAKELGHFEVRTSSSQVTRMHLFLKKVDYILVVALKIQRQPTPLRLFHCPNKQIKRCATRDTAFKVIRSNI